ncbi:carboxypeptidase regulatory-like domain-containing protein [Actinoplanes sp. NEAU-A12]|uniref:alpha-amylase n=1 Tax=Actinoplanes sandaracinus TaxID=3045177 RepID=A0ABT6WZZ3_9ACTN|nr:carboxypeptidase regulatory-like domain-containing protein [Actinoplanes sandaracinus]MDI6105326.1 carboxypeptidase regulatory-like domain-containing protein [Actinoplanes sandaracinus]
MIQSFLLRLGGAVAAGLLMVAVIVAPASAAEAGNVAGVHTNHAGEPIAEAWVAAWSAVDGSYLGGSSTDAAGHYSLTGVPAGGVRLSFQTESLIQWAPGLLVQDDARVYQVPAAGTLTVDERRRPTGVISGVLTGSAGAPAAWVTVDTHDLAGGTHANAYTDGAGRYTMTVWAGDHHVGFGSAAAKQWAPQVVTEEKAGKIAVAPGATVRVDERLLPTGTVRGLLTGVDGSPLAGADVRLYAGGNLITTSSTGDEGTYAFTVLPGDYTVSFLPEPNRQEQYVPGVLDKAKAKAHTVAAGQTVAADDTVLKPSTVLGRLAGADGAPKTGFQVFVMSTDEQHGYSAKTGAGGSWQVDGVHPGDYRVSFTNASGSRVQWARGKNTSADTEIFTVAGGASVTVNDTWLPGATLIVNAVDEVTGEPVSEFCAQVEIGISFDESCAKTGTATLLDVAPGSATIDVVPAGKSYFLRKDGTPATLAAGQTATATVRLAKGGKVSFSASSGATGAAVAKTCFLLRAIDQGGLPDEAGNCTNAKGQVTGPTLAPGTYAAFALAPGSYGHQWVGASGGTGDQKEAARIVITADTTVAAPNARLDPAGTITGVVTGADGAPIADADVSFTAWGFGPGPIHSVNTDERGKYTIGQLGPYAWPLSFTANGYPRQWSGNVGDRSGAVRVPVTAGATATYDMALTRASSLSGKVTVPAGLPATGWRFTVINAVTGDQVAEFDSYGQGPDGTYTLPVIGGQQVKVRWLAIADGNVLKTGWFGGAADQNSATGVDIPAAGVKRLNLTLD